MANRNIEMNIKTESGYDILYPLTTPQQAGSLPISGGTLTGPLMLNREPQENMEAVNKNYVDTGLSQKLSLTGGTMAGNISMGSHRITNLSNPSSNNDAVNKSFVENLVWEGLDTNYTIKFIGAKQLTKNESISFSTDGALYVCIIIYCGVTGNKQYAGFGGGVLFPGESVNQIICHTAPTRITGIEGNFGSSGNSLSVTADSNLDSTAVVMVWAGY